MSRATPAEPQTPPGSAPDTLAEANHCVALLVDRHRPALDRADRLAAGIHSLLSGLFPTLNLLCEATCPDCETPCCRRATVIFDHPDLIFLRLTNRKAPPLQPRPSPGRPCNYLGPQGCLLSRAGRPWICTWYICPPQKKLLDHNALRAVNQIMADIKNLRKEMEEVFIQVVA